MSLNRTFSPSSGGEWSSPGRSPGGRNLNRNIRRSPSPQPPRWHQEDDPRRVTWESAKAKKHQVNGYAEGGWFSKKMSSLLPNFDQDGRSRYDGAGRMPSGRIEKLKYFSMVLWRHAWRWRSKFAILLALIFLYVLFYTTRTFGAILTICQKLS